MEPFIGAPSPTARNYITLATGMTRFTENNTFHPASDLLFSDLTAFDSYDLSSLPPPPPHGAGMAFGSVSLELEETNLSAGLNQSQRLLMDGSRMVGDEAIDKGGKVAEQQVDMQTTPRERLQASPFPMKKAMSPEKLAELATVDPKKAKRIIANRKSAAKSKERRNGYLSGLEQEMEMLRINSTNISTNFNLVKSETEEMTSNNKEIKVMLEEMRHQSQDADELLIPLREEVRIMEEQSNEYAARIAHNTSSPSYGGPVFSDDQFHQVNPPPPPPPPQFQVPPPPPPSSDDLPLIGGNDLVDYYFSGFNPLN